jgi:Dockerin type I domain
MPPKVVLFTGVLAAALAAPSLAQPFGRTGAEFRVNHTTGGFQRSPSVGMDAKGRFFVVWSGPDGSGRGVFGRRFQHNGAPIDSADFGVNVNTTGDQFVPWVAVAPNTAFDAMVVFEKDQASGNESFGRRFDSTGPLSGTFQVGSSTSIYYIFPRAAADSSGNFVAVWNQGGSVMGQRYSHAGGPLGNAFTAGTDATNGRPRVARAPGGAFVIAWVGSSYQRISAHRYAANGSSLGSTFQVSQTSALMYDAAVAMNDSQFVVTWSAGVSSPQVLARLFDNGGAALTGELMVNEYTTGFRQYLDVAMNGNGGFVVVWEDDNDRDGGGGVPGASIWARRFNASGTALAGGEFLVNSVTTADQRYPRIAEHSNGDFVVVWEGDSTGSYEIYAQRFCHQLAGDANGDGTLDLADVFYLINNLFASGPAPVRNSDADGNGTTELADVFYLINYLFAGGPAPQCPAPV